MLWLQLHSDIAFLNFPKSFWSQFLSDFLPLSDKLATISSKRMESLDDVLPSILLLIDDHETTKVIQGLEKLLLCLQNFDRGGFLRRNWALVVYEALQKLIHEKDNQVISKLGVALIKILDIIEQNPNEKCDKLTKYDDTIKNILFMLELSSNLSQKKDWMPHFTSILEKMGLASMHWVDRINSMLLDYASASSDSELWIMILNCIQVLIKNTWVKPSSRNWMQIIIKILYNQGLVETSDKGLVARTEHSKKPEVLHQVIRATIQLMSYCDDFSEVSNDLKQTVATIKSKKDSKLYQQSFVLELEKCNLNEILS